MTLTPEGRTELALSGGCTCCATPTSSIEHRADAAALEPAGHSSAMAVAVDEARAAVVAR
jgi:hypothetical protein